MSEEGNNTPMAKNKPGWSALKTELTTLDFGLLRDLYEASPDNQAFLHASFGLGDDVLSHYKATITRFVCPDLNQGSSVVVFLMGRGRMITKVDQLISAGLCRDAKGTPLQWSPPA